MRLLVVAIALVVTVPAGTPASAAVLVSERPLTAWRVDGVMYAVRVAGDVTYIGGAFTRATAPDGTTRPRANLAAFDTHTGALIDGFRADTYGPVRALASDGTTLWVGLDGASTWRIFDHGVDPRHRLAGRRLRRRRLGFGPSRCGPRAPRCRSSRTVARWSASDAGVLRFWLPRRVAAGPCARAHTHAWGVRSRRNGLVARSCSTAVSGP